MALYNKLGEGEVWWFTPTISMSCTTLNNSADVAKICEALLSDKLAEQPFRFASFADGALMRVLRNGDEYVTVLTNNMYTPCTIKLISPKGLKATPIFGEAKISKSGKVTLGDRETLVLRWK